MVMTVIDNSMACMCRMSTFTMHLQFISISIHSIYYVTQLEREPHGMRGGEGGRVRIIEKGKKEGGRRQIWLKIKYPGGINRITSYSSYMYSFYFSADMY